MTTAPGRRGGAGASARKVAEAARVAERIEQHRRAKVALPTTAVCAAVFGYAAASSSVATDGAAELPRPPGQPRSARAARNS
ncbi:hypothetical protein [Streptomyces lydicus]|uniref:hypothetical protein n=1 Tax=Streptomyces lydicus TaxID=47763 RepID=UPI0036E67E57